MSRPTVVVIGAGLAGLTAAWRLATNGHSVVVVEARDRVGGRVWSERLPNGAVVELGGEWITDRDRTLLDLAATLDVALVPTAVDFLIRQPVEGPEIAENVQRDLGEGLAAALIRLGDQIEDVTAASVVDSLTGDPVALRLLRSRLTGSAGQDLTAVAASELGGEFGSTPGGYLRVAGGNQRLAEALAAPPMAVRTEWPVTAIETDKHGVMVHGPAGVVGAAVAVVTLPLGTLRQVSFAPALPHPLQAAIAGLRMGAAAKLAVPVAAPPPLLARQSLERPGWYWTGRGRSGPRPAVTSFVGTAAAVGELSVDEWRHELEEAVPEVEITGPGLTANWLADPWAGGCYSALGPGDSRHLAAFRAGTERLVFAGEHTTGSGTMEGAARSGIEAAAAVTRLLESVD